MNDAQNVEVYQASNNASNWNMQQTMFLLTELPFVQSQTRNANTIQEGGAFEQGSATYGWENYNPLESSC
ncbi:hypothetical protein [Chryseobacterium indoltheticum]|uniref:hypothetical protein n=1 Tax=Chryseobacterium indoltheticum TaxID=254 RepID=UPI003F4939EB